MRPCVGGERKNRGIKIKVESASNPSAPGSGAGRVGRATDLRYGRILGVRQQFGDPAQLRFKGAVAYGS